MSSATSLKVAYRFVAAASLVVAAVIGYFAMRFWSLVGYASGLFDVVWRTLAVVFSVAAVGLLVFAVASVWAGRRAASLRV